jgi:DeoR/GlpR family transcriptional regulator of sugar metabolism
MLTTSRKALLLARLEQKGQLTVTTLAKELGLSEDTLRRDLRDLAAEGKLVRVHGGAVPASPTHQRLASREGMHTAEKRQLARAVVSLIRPGMVVIVDGGTTHIHLADALPEGLDCTVVTHSPAIAMSLERHEGIEVVLLGGRMFRHSMVAMGPETALAYGRLSADLCLLGVTGVHKQLGLTTGDSAEAELKRVMIGSAAEAVVLATPDKIGRASPWQIAEITAISTLVTMGTRPEGMPQSVGHVRA